MKAPEQTDPHIKGVAAIGNAHFFLARTCFEEAAVRDGCHESRSYLAFCQAKTQAKYDDAAILAQQALAAEPANAVHYLNLGRIHLLAGNRKAAVAVFREGIAYDLKGEIVRELEALGTRRPLVFPSLPRSHPLNRFIGYLLRLCGR